MKKYLFKKMIFFSLALAAWLVCTAISARAETQLDLATAIKIGTGKKVVIEFTDPDCPFCRKAASYLHGRQGLTRYIFFKPLARHPAAKEKAQYILSATDQAKAYEDTMQGKYDALKPGPITPKGIRLLERHQAIAAGQNIKSTPTFMVYGRIVEGFNQQKLDELLR